ncbi:MAG TPA: D-glycerate dehydrogenase [Candidatus Acidoferrum sp.]|nr:D-glycerate dehydrogenase [Candidatus Acidoferrum sp.]
MKPKVYVTRLLPKEAMDRIHSNCEATVWDGELPPPRDVLLKNVADVEGLLSLLTDKIDAELMDKAPKLKVVSNYAVGFDNINIPEATKRGIIVGNTPGVLTDTTADFAFTLIMSAARRVAEGDRYVRAGKWKTWGPMLLLGQDVYGSTLGIIGLGRIGAAVARRAKGFNMRTMYYDVIRQKQYEDELGIEYATLDKVLTESDFITVHTNLTPETHHLISTKQFEKMKRTCILLNTSRGPIVDNMALYEALRTGRILYAGLDVTEPEPLPANHPLLTLDNVIIAPHIASASVVTRTKMGLIAADNLIAGLKGQLGPAPVNPEVLKKR